MKVIFNTILVVFTILFANSCATEESIKVNPDFALSFQKDGNGQAFVGNKFYVILKGSGEYVTLYDGTPGHVWGEAGASGVPFDKADSLPVTYTESGKYKLSVISTSTSDFGNSEERLVKTTEINVEDDRMLITSFYINDANGKILYNGSITNDSIVFEVPDIVTDLNFKPVFNLQSPSAKVYVNEVEQTSNQSQVNFNQTVDYKVLSSFGNYKTYHVKAHVFAASNEKSFTKFNLAPNLGASIYNKSNGEIGVIDNDNSVINLSVNYGTVRTSTKLVLESSYLSSILINGFAYNPTKTNYNLNTINQIKIIAQNKSEKIYTLNINDQDPITKFSFLGLIPAPVGIIDKVAKTITVNVLTGTDLTKLVAKWEGTLGDIKIGSVLQINGKTANNFSNPVSYTFFKGTTQADTYTVIVNVK